MDRLIYPTEDVPLEQLVRAALAHVGAANVAVVSGSGSRAVRIPADAEYRVGHAAGLPGYEPPHPPPEDGASGSAEVGSESGPDPDAPKTAAPDTDEPGRPAGRTGDRPAKKTTARRTTQRRKEG